MTLPAEIKVWRSTDTLDHTGTWATTRYPAEAVTYVPKADAELAVALAYQRVWDEISGDVDDQGRLVFSEYDERRILALAPAEPLAEVQALKAERDGLEERNSINSRMAEDQFFLAEAAEAEVARLKVALTLIERVYYLEEKDAAWKIARMNGIAREAQDGNDLGHYRRIFPRAALKGGTP